MKRPGIIKPFLLVSLLLLFVGTDVSAKDEWIKVRSKNFSLIGNASEKDIRQVATRLEQFRLVFSNLLLEMKVNSPVSTTVVVFRDDRALTPFKPLKPDGKPAEWIAGYFQPSDDINYIALSAGGERGETYRTIFHEYVHFLVGNTLGRSNMSPWFNEGLAEYYERFEIKNDQKVTLGAVNPASIDILARNQLIPLETFFNVDYPSLHQQGSHGVGIFYAQSWALMHYLIREITAKEKLSWGFSWSFLPPAQPFQMHFGRRLALITPRWKTNYERT